MHSAMALINGGDTPSPIQAPLKRQFDTRWNSSENDLGPLISETVRPLIPSGGDV